MLLLESSSLTLIKEWESGHGSGPLGRLLSALQKEAIRNTCVCICISGKDDFLIYWIHYQRVVSRGQVSRLSHNYVMPHPERLKDYRILL